MNELESLLARIEAGNADSGALERARELLSRLEAAEPLPLAAAVWEEAGTVDVGEEVVVEVTGDFGMELDVPLFGAALRDEAGEIDLAGDVLAAITGSMPLAEAVRDELSEDLPIAEAVRFEAGRVEIADAVLAALGLSDATIPLGAAVRGEAGRVEVAEAVLAELGLRFEPLPLAEAIRAEAGRIDVRDTIDEVTSPAWLSAMLDHELSESAHRAAARRVMREPALTREMTAFAEIGRELRAGIEAEGGEVPAMWDGVARGIGLSEPEAVEGWDGALFAEAVRAEAGTVDVTREVMKRIRRQATVPVSIETPEPANNGLSWGTIALVAVALFAVLIGRGYFEGDLREAPPLASTKTAQVEAAAPAYEFADPDEIVVTDLSYAQNAMVQVYQDGGQDGALIIWLDEETL